MRNEEVLVFPSALVRKISTSASGGWILTFDIDEQSAKELPRLMSIKEEPLILCISVQPESSCPPDDNF